MIVPNSREQPEKIVFTIYAPLKPIRIQITQNTKWYHYNDITFLNAARISMFCPVYYFKICKFNSVLFSACHIALVLLFQFFHTTKVIVSDIQNCCSDEHLFTVP